LQNLNLKLPDQRSGCVAGRGRETGGAGGGVPALNSVSEM
jgi:hypothetical protein